MKNFEIIPLFAYMATFLIILLISELIYKWLIKDSEFTSKISHTITGIAALGIPVFFDGYLEVTILGIFSFLLLFISKRMGLFHSIHKLDRVSYGASLLPIAIFICYVASEELDNSALFYVPVLILSISDPAAGLVGSNFNSLKWKRLGAVAANKSLLGSLTFSISALVILLLALPQYYKTDLIPLFLISLALATISGIVELISGKGTDNLTVPLSLIVMLQTMNYLL